MKEKFANFRGIKKIEVVEVFVNEGEGVAGDPIYRESYYIRLDTGEMIGNSSKEPLRKFANDN